LIDRRAAQGPAAVALPAACPRVLAVSTRHCRGAAGALLWLRFRTPRIAGANRAAAQPSTADHRDGFAAGAGEIRATVAGSPAILVAKTFRSGAAAAPKTAVRRRAEGPTGVAFRATAQNQRDERDVRLTVRIVRIGDRARLAARIGGARIRFSRAAGLSACETIDEGIAGVGGVARSIECALRVGAGIERGTAPGEILIVVRNAARDDDHREPDPTNQTPAHEGRV